ncbi:D-alanyl-D-alanine carboxypeptidase, partial [bacterium]|nr:D-alanyl-D-alanine carboxypeptidase [bacterium]
FAMYESAEVPVPADAPESLPVDHGVEETVALHYTAPDRCLMPKGQGATITAELDLPDTVAAPVTEGTILGTLNIKNGEGILQTCPITAAQDVAVRDFGFCFRRLVDGFLLEA